MKLCHLIMTYKNAAQLNRLVKALSSPAADIYVHVDKKFDVDLFKQIEGGPNVYFIENRQRINWGGFSLVAAVIASLDEIRSKNKYYDFINLISGQDYPIRTASAFEAFLGSNKGKCFISYDVDVNRAWWNENIVRLTRYHFNDFTVRGKYLVQRIVNFILPKRKFPMKWELYGGNCSSWWTLSSEAAYYFADTVKNNQKLRRFARLTWAPDEYIYATVLMNSQFRHFVVNNNYRYIDWSEKNANPKLLTAADFETFAASDNFFARKFDLSTGSEPLDLIDQNLGLTTHATSAHMTFPGKG